MFQFLHPRPVVDRRPVAEHSIQVRAVTLPALTALSAPPMAQPTDPPKDPVKDPVTEPPEPAAALPALSPPAVPSARGPASGR